MYSRLLVGVDFSDHSFLALEHALSLALLTRGDVQVLHVYEALVPPPDLAVQSGTVGGTLLPSFDIADSMHASDVALRDALTARGLENRTTPVVRIGEPALVLVEFAREAGCDLIVVGTHGRTGLSRVLLGSVAEKVVRRSPCPVLVVPHASHPPGR